MTSQSSNSEKSIEDIKVFQVLSDIFYRTFSLLNILKVFINIIVLHLQLQMCNFWLRVFLSILNIINIAYYTTCNIIIIYILSIWRRRDLELSHKFHDNFCLPQNDKSWKRESNAHWTRWCSDRPDNIGSKC